MLWRQKNYKTQLEREYFISLVEYNYYSFFYTEKKEDCVNPFKLNKKVQHDPYETNMFYSFLVSPIYVSGEPRINNYLLHLLSK